MTARVGVTPYFSFFPSGLSAPHWVSSPREDGFSQVDIPIRGSMNRWSTYQMTMIEIRIMVPLMI